MSARIWRALVAAGALVLAIGAAWPAAARAENGIAAFGGWRGGSGLANATTGESIDFDDTVAGSLALNFTYDAARQWELFFSNQSTTLTSTDGTGGAFRMPLRVVYAHIGGTNFWEGPVGKGPYMAAGLGVSVFSPGLDGYSNETRPSLNIGFGYRVPLFGPFSLRAEARLYLTLINSSSFFLCNGGNCALSIKGDSLQQYEAMLGLYGAF